MLGDNKLLTLIRKIAKDNDISSYQIGESTTVSQKTAYNILNDDEIKPRTKTLHIVLNYLENAIVGSKGDLDERKEYTTAYRNKHTQRPPESLQFENLGIEEKLNEMYELLKANQGHILQNKKDISTSINNNLERFEIVRIQVEKINAKTKSNKKSS